MVANDKSIISLNKGKRTCKQKWADYRSPLFKLGVQYSLLNVGRLLRWILDSQHRNTLLMFVNHPSPSHIIKNWSLLKKLKTSRLFSQALEFMVQERYSDPGNERSLLQACSWVLVTWRGRDCVDSTLVRVTAATSVFRDFRMWFWVIYYVHCPWVHVVESVSSSVAPVSSSDQLCAMWSCTLLLSTKPLCLALLEILWATQQPFSKSIFCSHSPGLLSVAWNWLMHPHLCDTLNVKDFQHSVLLQLLSWNAFRMNFILPCITVTWFVFPPQSDFREQRLYLIHLCSLLLMLHPKCLAHSKDYL